MGLYASTLSGTWRAKQCNNNEYGVTNLTYGLSSTACRPCPAGTLASSDAAAYNRSAAHYVTNRDGTGGFVSERACVTKPGERARPPAGIILAG